MTNVSPQPKKESSRIWHLDSEVRTDFVALRVSAGKGTMLARNRRWAMRSPRGFSSSQSILPRAERTAHPQLQGCLPQHAVVEKKAAVRFFRVRHVVRHEDEGRAGFTTEAE